MNRPTTDSAPWQLRLFGNFTLIRPSGESVRLPDRKTEGLLAILALNREFGVARQDAANILWPGRGPQNLANLRQALAVLRRVLGADAIESTTAHCRLSSTFELVEDYGTPALRGEGGFMPGHEGDWFEDVRIETSSGASESATIFDHYFQSLRWLATYDPRSMYAMLGATPAMARSLPYLDLGLLLEETKNSNPPRGWYSFWLGTVKCDLDECIGLLRFALREARKDSDLNLAAEVSLELGRAYSRTGQLQRALKICDVADEIASRIRTKAARLYALRLRGTVQFQWHGPEEGQAMLRRLEDELENPIEVASMAHMRSFFEASNGQFEQAEATYRYASKIASECGHFRMGILAPTTNAVLVAARGNRTEGLSQLTALAARFYAHDASQFGVYAEELVAKLSLLDGDKAAASQAWRSAKRERQRSRMAMTPIEARRIAVMR